MTEFINSARVTPIEGPRSRVAAGGGQAEPAAATAPGAASAPSSPAPATPVASPEAVAVNQLTPASRPTSLPLPGAAAASPVQTPLPPPKPADEGKTWGGPSSTQPLNFGHPLKNGKLFEMDPSGIPVWASSGKALTANQFAAMPDFQKKQIRDEVAAFARRPGVPADSRLVDAFDAAMKTGQAALATRPAPEGTPATPAASPAATAPSPAATAPSPVAALPHAAVPASAPPASAGALPAAPTQEPPALKIPDPDTRSAEAIKQQGAQQASLLLPPRDLKLPDGVSDRDRATASSIVSVSQALGNALSYRRAYQGDAAIEAALAPRIQELSAQLKAARQAQASLPPAVQQAVQYDLEKAQSRLSSEGLG